MHAIIVFVEKTKTSNIMSERELAKKKEKRKCFRVIEERNFMRHGKSNEFNI